MGNSVQDDEIMSFSEGMQKTSADYEKEIYDLQQLLEISRSLCTTLELPTLIESILYITLAQMRVLGAGVFILQALDSHTFYLGNNYSGLEIDQSIDYSIPVESKLIEYISNPSAVFTIQELKAKFPKLKELKMLDSLHPTLIVPLILKNHLNGILLLGERIAFTEVDAAYTDYEKKEISTIASLAAVAVNNASLVELSSTDMMTHLKLKYYFFNVLTDKLDLASQDKQSLSVLMFDIDFFKKFNDTYGHACGDYVLQEVAKIIKESIRAQDMASRYGGEEFTVMLNNTTSKEAMIVADRIRRNVAEHDFYYQDMHMNATISGGVAVYSADEDGESAVISAKTLVDQADQALYFSKRNGRNQVTLAAPELLMALEKGESAAKKAAPSAGPAPKKTRKRSSSKKRTVAEKDK